MDSLTQIALGASVAAVCVKAEHRRKAVLIGAALGTLPDLDVLIDYGDAVSNFTYHRGFSHSLFVLIPFAIGLWWLFKQWLNPVKEAPRRWFYAILLALATHPLLDAHTVYGTQLLWPIPTPPVMWSTIFIIDPLYTLPLLIAVIALVTRPTTRFAARALSAGLILSSLYLGWSWTAKGWVEARVERALTESGGRILTTPAPFNTLVWRILVVDGDSYKEGYYSLLAPQRPIEFSEHDKNTTLINAAKHLASVDRLQWFSHGFIKGSLQEEYLVITDLRMGVEGSYVFNHAVANNRADGFEAITSQQLPASFSGEALARLWEQIKAMH